MTLQVPVRHDQVVWDDRPFVSPLVDVADRGAMSGVVLVGGDFVRLLQIADGNIDEPDDSTYELSLGDWRPYEAVRVRQSRARTADRLPPRAV